MRILSFEYIQDAQDRADAEHGNCVYIVDDSDKYRIPLYFNSDSRLGWVGDVRGGIPDSVRLDALKFITALGYVPVMEGLENV